MAKVKVFKDFTQNDSFLIKVRHNPVKNLTGAVFTVTLKQHLNDASAALSVSTTAGDHASDAPTNGLVYIPITQSDTVSLPPGTYYGSIRRTIGSDSITILRSGKNNVDRVTCFEKLD